MRRLDLVILSGEIMENDDDPKEDTQSQVKNSVNMEKNCCNEDTFRSSPTMDEIRRLFGSPVGRIRSDSIASSATQSSGSRLLLRQRLAQLMTCVDDLDPSPQLQEQVARSLDNAFLICGKRASRPKKENFSLQEVYTAPHRFIIDMAVEDSWSHLFMSSLAPRGYLKVSSIRMQGLLLLFFSKLAHVPFIRDIQATYTRTGIFGYWGNKGGVSIRLSFYGHMLCFLNCHLAAHMQYALQRVDEFEYILDTQTFDPKKTPQILDHKLVYIKRTLVFWFGDLNFRIQDHGMHFLRNCITSHKFNLLWSKDQLTMMKKKEALLQEFDEGPLDFQPTYKFDRFSDCYDSSGKMRKPAWTDRILWRVKPKEPPPEEEEEEDEDRDSGLDEKNTKQQQEAEEEEFPLKLKQDSYTSNMEYGVSDHKPLRKMYETPLVRVCAEGEWSADFDAMVIYSPLQPFPSSAWDWIGLYKVGFRSVSDYITYTWVKDDEVSFNDELTQVYVSKDEIPVLGGECILCYYCSTLQCIVGISSPFKEGLASENIKILDKATASSDL
ncbi:unnamed protein product [Coregonus sp. 'balchen']|nr:unnamed protein product [Coregonus sp. 'balchen']